MSGSADGARKVAATRIGVSLAEYDRVSPRAVLAALHGAVTG